MLVAILTPDLLSSHLYCITSIPLVCQITGLNMEHYKELSQISNSFSARNIVLIGKGTRAPNQYFLYSYFNTHRHVKKLDIIRYIPI